MNWSGILTRLAGGRWGMPGARALLPGDHRLGVQSCREEAPQMQSLSLGCWHCSDLGIWGRWALGCMKTTLG